MNLTQPVMNMSEPHQNQKKDIRKHILHKELAGIPPSTIWYSKCITGLHAGRDKKVSTRIGESLRESGCSPNTSG